MKNQLPKKLLIAGLPIVGFLFCLYYIHSAWMDVIYTDYIRIACYYLPGAFWPSTFFVKDILTRIPLNYLERAINVVFFHYNTFVDMTMGIVGLTISAWILGYYCMKKKIGTGWYVLILFVLFSLNKWEMLINGTGWVHFMAFACFFYHYIVADRVLIKKEAKQWDDLRMKLLPFIIVLGVAGPYCAIYCLILMMLYLWVLLCEYHETKEWNKNYIAYFFCMLIPLLLYILSNHFVDEPLKGVQEGSIFAYFPQNPILFVKFFLKSFSSMIVGEETAEALGLTGAFEAVLGLLVIFSYLASLFLYWKEKIYKETWFPLILLLSGGLNHLLVLYARWRFLDDTYGMSSRYALQYQVGIFGILLTFSLAVKHWKRWSVLKKYSLLFYMTAFCLILTGGNYKTSVRELDVAHYRKEYAARLIEAAYDYKNMTDEELAVFQYTTYPKKTRKALEIMEENHYSMFRKEAVEQWNASK